MNPAASEIENDQARRIKSHADQIARRLRWAADDIERQVAANVHRALTRDGKFGPPDYTTAASRAVNQLVWNFANLNLGQLVDAAADADRTRLTGE